MLPLNKAAETFMEAIRERNTVETDAFFDIFEAYHNVCMKLHVLTCQQSFVSSTETLGYPEGFEYEQNLAGNNDRNTEGVETSHDQQEVCRVWETRIGDPAAALTERSFSLQSDGMASAAGDLQRQHPLAKRNVMLRAQVEKLEARLRLSTAETRAAQRCLRDLDRELKRKVFYIRELESRISQWTSRCASPRLHQPPHTLTNSPRGESGKLGQEDVIFGLNTKGPRQTLILLRKQVLPNSVLDNPPERGEGEDSFAWGDATARASKHTKSVKEGPLSSRFHTWSFTNKDILNDPRWCNTKQSLPRTKDVLQTPRLLFQPCIKAVSRPHSGAVATLCFSRISGRSNSPNEGQGPGGSRSRGLLVSGGYDGYVAVLEFSLLQVQFSLRVAPNESAIVLIGVASDCCTIAAACLDHVVYLTDVSLQRTVAAFRGHRARITGLGFIDIAMTSQEGDNEAEGRERQIERESAFFRGLQRFVYSTSLDRSIRLWSVCAVLRKGDGGTCIAVTKAMSGISAADYHGSQRALVLGHQNGCVSLWRFVALTVVRGSPEGEAGLVDSKPNVVAPGPNNSSSSSSSSSSSGTLETGVRDLQYGFQFLFVFHPLAPSLNRLLSALAIHDDGAVLRVQFSPDGTTVYSVGPSGTLIALSVNHKTSNGQLFGGFSELSVGEELGPISGVGAPFSCSRLLAVSPSGDRILCGSEHSLVCWDTQTTRCLGRWRPPVPTTCLSWSHQDTSVISGQKDGSLFVWHLF